MAMAKKPERKQKLKVFVTPIGFHDAYVAAPSQKAALEAWGADSNIFAQGIAEQVTDPKLMEEPLASPGKVIKRVRGSADEHFAELDRAAPKKKAAKESGKVVAAEAEEAQAEAETGRARRCRRRRSRRPRRSSARSSAKLTTSCRRSSASAANCSASTRPSGTGCPKRPNRRVRTTNRAMRDWKG